VANHLPSPKQECHKPLSVQATKQTEDLSAPTKQPPIIPAAHADQPHPALLKLIEALAGAAAFAFWTQGDYMPHSFIAEPCTARGQPDDELRT
jgi:hypothetical protein